MLAGKAILARRLTRLVLILAGAAVNAMDRIFLISTRIAGIGHSSACKYAYLQHQEHHRPAHRWYAPHQDRAASHESLKKLQLLSAARQSASAAPVILTIMSVWYPISLGDTLPVFHYEDFCYRVATCYRGT